MADPSAGGLPVPARRRGYAFTAAVLLLIMLGGTLPVPLYVLYEQQMGFGPLGVTVVFAAYVLGTLFALVALGDLSDHVGRRKVLALAVVCAAVSTGLFLAATNIWWLIVARVVSGVAAGLVTGTATAALAELQPRGDHRAAAVVASGSNMTGLGLGPLIAGLFAEYVAMPLHSVFWAYLGICAVALAAVLVIPETVRTRTGRSASGPGSPPRRRSGRRHARRLSGRLRRVHRAGAVQQPGADLPAWDPRRAQPRAHRGCILPDLRDRCDQPGGLRPDGRPAAA